MQFDRRDGALGSILEHETGEEETAAEEVECKSVKDANFLSAHDFIRGVKEEAYNKRMKKATTSAC